MTTSGKKPLIFGRMSITPYTNFDTAAKGSAATLDRFLRQATLQINAETGDATGAGDDGVITVFGREMYDFSFELWRSRAASGSLAALGLASATTDLRSVIRYYEVVLSEERSATGVASVTFNALCSQLMVIDTNARATDASSMSLTWPVIGTAAITLQA